MVKELIKKTPRGEFPEKFKEAIRRQPGAFSKNDFVYMKAVVVGKRGQGEKVEIEKEMMVRSDENWTSMQIATGFSAAIIAKLVADGKAKPGAHPPEIALDTNSAIEALKKDFRIFDKTTPLN